MPRTVVRQGIGATMLAGSVLACGVPTPEFAERTTTPAAPAVCAPSAWVGAPQRVLAQGLDTPWGMVAAPDGRVFVTERAGRVRLIDSTGLHDEPWATLPVAAVGESGLLGVMLAPDYATSGALLVSGTYAKPGRSRSTFMRAVRRAQRMLGVDPGTDFELQVHRVWHAASASRAGSNDTVGASALTALVFTGVPAAPLHPGGAMLPLADDRFMLSTGDSNEPGSAARDDDPRGKLLTVPIANGAMATRVGAGARVVAKGVRNPQGIVRVPGDSTIVFIDHGPTGSAVEGGRSGRDELNRFVADGDFGWPRESGIHQNAQALSPMLEWTAGIAPAGVAALADPVAPDTRVDLFVSALRGQGLRRIALERMKTDSGESATVATWSVRCEESVMDASRGRIRAVAAHPGGGLLVATSNRDSRGAPRPGDDHVIWIQPQATP